MKLLLPKPGKYVVAVSGGIDSVCLLNMMVKIKDYELIVAHFDHGIRIDSGKDLKFVSLLAKKYGLDFYSDSVNLGPNASEESARKARYTFLYQVMAQTSADSIITAHHQDDRLETVFINLVRGTGRKGLTSITNTETIKRPLLNATKAELKSYACQHNLSWREDTTNSDLHYLRNYIRHSLVPKLSVMDRQRLIKLMDNQQNVNDRLDNLLKLLLDGEFQNRLSRSTINILPYNLSKELIAAWLRCNNLVSFDRRMIDRLTIAAKTKRPGTIVDVYNKAQIRFNKEYLALGSIER